MLQRLQDPPTMFVCGSHYDLVFKTNETVAYTKLLYRSSNLGDQAGLDLETGVFTAGHPGNGVCTSLSSSLSLHRRDPHCLLVAGGVRHGGQPLGQRSPPPQRPEHPGDTAWLGITVCFIILSFWLKLFQKPPVDKVFNNFMLIYICFNVF